MSVQRQLSYWGNEMMLNLLTHSKEQLDTSEDVHSFGRCTCSSSWHSNGAHYVLYKSGRTMIFDAMRACIVRACVRACMCACMCEA